MLAGFLLTLREGIEAALIVGLIAGVLRRMRGRVCIAAMWAGVAAGVASSVVAAVFLRALGLRFRGDAEMIYEGAVSLAAAALLTGMIFWMRRNAERVNDVAKRGLQVAVRSGRGAVFAIAFVAIIREGIELALFLNAAVLRSAADAILAGAALGLLAAAACGWAIFASALRFDVRRFFQISGAFLLVFAAGLLLQAIGDFVDLGWIPPLVEPVWNTGAWLPEESVLGGMLKTLVGYKSAPSLMEIATYSVFVIAVVVTLRHAHCRHDGCTVAPGFIPSPVREEESPVPRGEPNLGLHVRRSPGDSTH